MIRNIREAKANEEGFTLIELLVVVIIIGILAAIAIPAFLNQRERAWQSELTSTVRNVALEIEAEATAFGGDYTQVVGDTTTTFAGFISESLDTLQGALADPVVLAEGNVTRNAFCIIGTHVALLGDDGDFAIGADNPKQVYESDESGLKPFDPTGADAVNSVCTN